MASQEIALVQQPSPASLQRSEELRRGVRNKVMAIERSVVLSKQQRAASAKRAGEIIKEKVQLRIKENVAAIKAAEMQMRAVDDSVKATGLSVTRLTHEKYKQFAALQVCQRRIELRKPAPPEKDGIQEALNTEESVLLQSRGELEKLEVEVKAVIEELKGTRAYLTRDAANRRHEVETDRARLVNVALASTKAPGVRPLEDVEQSVHASHGSRDATTERSIEMPEQSVVATVDDVEDTRSVCIRSVQLRERAETLRETSQKVIKDVREKCNRATARVKARLTKFNESALEVTRQLIGQGKEVDWTIEMARRSLDAQKKNLHICNRAQEMDYQRAKDMLDELRKSRVDLSHDLRQKTLSLNISESCRKVIAQRAKDPSKELQRASSAGSCRKKREGKNDPHTLPSLANSDQTRSSPGLRQVEETAALPPSRSTAFAAPLESFSQDS